MTNKEAIEIIKIAIAEVEWDYPMDYAAAFDMAIKALEKQKPVNPKFIDGKRNHFITCGNCNTNLMRGMKFCSYCGRAVKWE